MNPRNVPVRLMAVIVLLLVIVNVLATAPTAAVACTYDCSWEELCIFNHQNGCKQFFGTSVFDPYRMVFVCVENCSNPCSATCFK